MIVVELKRGHGKERKVRIERTAIGARGEDGTIKCRYIINR